MSGNSITDALDSFNSGLKTVSQTGRQIGSTARSATNATRQFGKLASATGITPAQQGGKQTSAAQQPVASAQSSAVQQPNVAPQPAILGSSSTDVLTSEIVTENGRRYFKNTAPAGTRIIIPAVLSSTGQERYLGKCAVTSILNLSEGKEGSGNIVVLGANGLPSEKYYDIDSNGDVFIKGTKKPAHNSIEGDNKSVVLTEQEYESVVDALNKKSDEVVYYRTTEERGQSEESTRDTPSWFSRNWWIVLLGAVAVAGATWGGIALYNRHQKKKEDSANALSTLTEAVASPMLSAVMSNVSEPKQTGANTLSSSATQVTNAQDQIKTPSVISKGNTLG